ncbi:hypothetical protein M569_09262 [Genlisea aurea]|uniref:Uncharacterized protein n=1 Tax=Genlisea aurea TaxID=192259 RepID=S8CF23_9LAMI|nr:hypothetical protein M569_09262 [Genlisea aurea]
MNEVDEVDSSLLSNIDTYSNTYTSFYGSELYVLKDTNSSSSLDMEFEFQHPYQQLDFTLAQLDVYKDPKPHPTVRTHAYEAAVALRMPVVEEVIKLAKPDSPLAGLTPRYVVKKVLKLESIIRRQQHWRAYRATTERPDELAVEPVFNYVKYPWAQGLVNHIRNEIDRGAKALEDVKIVQRELVIMESYAKLFLKNPANKNWRAKYTDEEFLLRVWAWDLHSKAQVNNRTIRTEDGSTEKHDLPLSLNFDMDEEMCQDFANFKAIRMTYFPETPERTYGCPATCEVLENYTSCIAEWYRRRQFNLKAPMIFSPKDLGETITIYLEWEAERELLSLSRRLLRQKESTRPDPVLPKLDAEMVFLAQEYRNHRLTIGLPPHPHWKHQIQLAYLWQSEIPAEHNSLPALIETFTNAWLEERNSENPEPRTKFFIPTQLFSRKKPSQEDSEASSSSSSKPPSPKRKFSLERINKLKQTGLREVSSGACRRVLYELLLDFMHTLASKKKGPTFMDSIFDLPEEKLVDMVAIYVLNNHVIEHWQYAERMSELYSHSAPPLPLMPHIYLFSREFFVYLSNRYIDHGFHAPCVDIIAHYRLHDFYWTHHELVHQIATWLMKKPTETALSYDTHDIAGMVKINYHDVMLNTYRRFTRDLAPPGSLMPPAVLMFKRSQYVDPFILQTWREYLATDPSFSDEASYSTTVLASKETYLTAKAGEFLTTDTMKINSPWRTIIKARDLAKMTITSDKYIKEAARSSCAPVMPPIGEMNHLPLELIHEFRVWLHSQGFAKNRALALEHNLDHYVNYPLTKGLMKKFFLENPAEEQVEPLIDWQHINRPSDNSETSSQDQSDGQFMETEGPTEQDDHSPASADTLILCSDEEISERLREILQTAQDMESDMESAAETFTDSQNEQSRPETPVVHVLADNMQPYVVIEQLPAAMQLEVNLTGQVNLQIESDPEE